MGKVGLLYAAGGSACCLEDKLSRLIDQLENSGLLKDELAEYRLFESRYGGAVAAAAAELLIALWQEHH